MIMPRNTGFVDDRMEFVALPLVKILTRAIKFRAGISHAFVQETLIKLVAEVIVSLNVLPGTA